MRRAIQMYGFSAHGCGNSDHKARSNLLTCLCWGFS
jgi:hypothetical protein